MMGRYEIRSKLKPSLVLFKGWSPDVEADIERMKSLAHLKIPKYPQISNHVLRFGEDDLDYIILDKPELIETAALDVKKEKRGGKTAKVHI